MTKLEDYKQFEGLHWETGSVRNYLDYRGFTAPHTGKPFSEAFLMGISGGAVMGYFSFAYEGYDPHVVILTRNTFDPLDTLLERLGPVQNVLQTAKADRARKNLLEMLEDGVPAIVWADVVSLPYNAYPPGTDYWGMMPVVVYGYDQAADLVWISDRVRVPLTVTPAELDAARGRIKKIKHRILTLGPPNLEKLAGSVRLGIWDTIKLYTEKPPKGARHNFGFAAFERWSEVLTRPKMAGSWAKVFPPGRAMYNGLTTAFSSITTFGKDGGAERDMYADFLDEAGVLLEKPGLQAVADHFRQSARAWDRLATALLPDEIPLFKETRELMLRSHKIFLDQGMESVEERLALHARLEELKSQAAADFPLDQAEAEAFCQALSARIQAICEIEKTAVEQMSALMS